MSEPLFELETHDVARCQLRHLATGRIASVAAYKTYGGDVEWAHDSKGLPFPAYRHAIFAEFEIVGYVPFEFIAAAYRNEFVWNGGEADMRTLLVFYFDQVRQISINEDATR